MTEDKGSFVGLVVEDGCFDFGAFEKPKRVLPLNYLEERCKEAFRRGKTSPASMAA